MDIRRITAENAEDLKLHNEPFEMPGRFVPELKDGVWNWKAEYFEKPEIMAFPEENYEFDRVSRDGAAFGAYENGECVGLIVLKDAFWNYMYVHDLKVCSAARGKGAGRALIGAAMAESKARGYGGLYLQAQDNNLNACLFYQKAGFKIGGFDNHVYNGTSQEGKADIVFYLE